MTKPKPTDDEYEAAWSFGAGEALVCTVRADGDDTDDQWRFPDQLRAVPTGHGIVAPQSVTRPDVVAHALLQKTQQGVVEVYFVALDRRLVLATYLALNVLSCTIAEAVQLAREAKWEAEVEALGALRPSGSARTH